MGDTNLKTITFDPAVYKLVPVSSSADMREAASKADDEGFEEGRTHGASGTEIYEAMLAAVPEQLPRVVVHDGEPVGYISRASFKEMALNTPLNAHCPAIMPSPACPIHEDNVPLYTHPAPSQPIAPLGEKWAIWYDGSESEHHHAAYVVHFGIVLLNSETEAKEQCKRPAYTPRRVFVVDAIPAQPSAEALVQAALEAACTLVWETEHEDRAKVLEDIRVLDKQQIIESVKS